MNIRPRHLAMTASFLLCSIVAATSHADDAPDSKTNQDAASASKKPLDHDVYDMWKTIRGQAISSDGVWVLYNLVPGDGDAVLNVRSVADAGQGYEVVRGASARFSHYAGYAIYLIKPDKELVKKARKENKKKKKKKSGKGSDNLPKDALEILDLASGKMVTIDRVKSFRLPAEAGGWVAYLKEKPREEPPDSGAKKLSEGEEAEEKPETEEGKAKGEASEQEPTKTGEKKASGEAKSKPKTEAKVEQSEEPKKKKEAGEEEEEDGKKKKKKKKELGTELVLRNLETAAEYRYQNATAFAFSEDGKVLMFAASAEEGADDGVFIVTVGTGKVRQIIAGKGDYKAIVIDKAGKEFAFLTSRDDHEADKPAWTLYRWHKGMKEAELVAGEGTDGLAEGWWVAENRNPSFSENGKRLYFGTAPRPEPKPEEDEEDEKDDDEPEVKVDVWHWKDRQLQPQQLLQAEQERKRTYLAVAHLGDGKVVQLATEDVPNATVGSKGDADVAVGSSSLPYDISRSWDSSGYTDVYLIDVKTGERERVLEKVPARASLSPGSKYVSWWDGRELAWFAMSVKTKKTVNLTELLPHPVNNELHDTPSLPRSYGSAGWVEGDQAFLVYDRNDIWATNPDGFWPPNCVTDGFGRENDLRLRYVRLDPRQSAPRGRRGGRRGGAEPDGIDPEKPMLLSAFHLYTKASGFYRDQVRSKEPPTKVIMRDERMSTPRKAKEADALMFTRSTFERFPDVWVSDMDFGDMQRLSDANPQQQDYLWGTAELVDWSSLDGQKLQGILYKPEGFDPAKKYPMLVYFYERNSDNLHRHAAPAPARSSINYSFYVSRGYLLFVPDIPYRIGYPGQSAVNAILPGVASLIDKGFVDQDHIGTQGHSWGGYQTAYLVTRTNMFAAAESGAPVSNMTSAYGGIRWASGMSRMFQYEQTQSRIGGTLWNAQHKYIENSPVFWADKVDTPLLILHNDEDGAVPWYQGIELFVALRRLGKPAWMLNYNGEAHGLRKRHNQKDWSVRMQQFFDHYLKDAPPPVWLAEGVPAVKKGETLGLDLIQTRSEGSKE